MIWQICLFIFLAVSCSDGEASSMGPPLKQIEPSITALEKDFNTSQSDVAEGGSIFIHILDSKHWAQVEEKKILLAQLISMYLKMLTDISKTRTAKHIRDIVGALEDYEIKFSESLKKANDLMELVKLPMNDVKIQRKAVKELYHVLLEVHKEENKERRKRSRRHNPQVQNRCKPSLSG